jgi:Na+/citrate or Na+/malate symporter
MIAAIIMAVVLASLISLVWANLIAEAHEEYSEYEGEDLFGESKNEKE